ncbi:MAG: UDP-N-acetylmuramate dehydrogenase, partial [Clostridia bacterium]|nr:UDP-N-acetylmuramate dehydrogenase [Clostridia bacterium]
EHTTFRIGGNADYAVYPANSEQMSELIRFFNKNNVRYFVLGRGSDLLASDHGYRGVLVMTRQMNQLVRVEHRIIAGAGCSMASVSNFAQKEGLAGLEFLHGIPGSIGGGVFMNAGAYGSEMASFITAVEWVDEQGDLHRFNREEMDFSYRHSYFSDHPGVICSAEFLCEPGDPLQIRETTAELDRRRREKQPLEYPSAGSAFKRPEGHFAGKLIEDAGLKGFSVGGAQISEKHAGFIVNKGGATAQDVKDLIQHVVKTVQEQFGVSLEPEIRFLDE